MKPSKVFFKHKFVKFISLIYTRLFLGYRSKSKYKIQNGESVLVLSNHQTDADPLCIFTSFNKPVFPVATDNIFSSKMGHYLENKLGVIPKRKGTNDIKTIMHMFATVKDGGSILLFPEGNRFYAEFQYYVSERIVDVIKKLKVTLVLFKLSGGTGVRPRFSNKKRKGKFTGNIEKVLKYEEYKDMDNHDLYEMIMNTIKSYDSETGNLYRSKTRAEYLERMFFLCPKCGHTETLVSSQNKFYCTSCDFEVEYTEDLHFKGNYDIKNLEWWNLQKRYIKNKKFADGIIFSDENITLKSAELYEKKQVLYEGTMKIDKDYLYFGSLKLDLANIENASAISGIKLSFTHNGKNYLVLGHDRFNPLKYLFLFNKLDTKIKQEQTDHYYNLEEN